MRQVVGEDDAWKVGVLFSESGVTAIIEKTQLNATLLAIEEVNAVGGVNGKPIKPIAYDPESNPEKFKALAEHMLTQDRLSIFFGCYMSSTRKAVLPSIEKWRGLLFYPTLYEGFEYSPNCIYTGAAPNQNSAQLGYYLLKNASKRFYLVGSNYVYPYESNRIMSSIVMQEGGKVLEERYVGLGAEEDVFEEVAADIKEKQPDVVFSTVVGSDTTKLYRAYAKAGLKPEKMPIASLTTSEAEVAEMGAELAEGHITAAPYFEALETERNKAFVAAYRKRFGEGTPITAAAEAAYFQVHMFALALAQCGTTDLVPLRTALRGMEFDAPQGRVMIDPDNNHTYLWPRVGVVGPDGRFSIVREASRRVKPDPYLVAPSMGDWSAELSVFQD